MLIYLPSIVVLITLEREQSTNLFCCFEFQLHLEQFILKGMNLGGLYMTAAELNDDEVYFVRFNSLLQYCLYKIKKTLS